MELHLSAPKVGTNVAGENAEGVVVLGTWENYDASGIDPEVTTHQIRFTDGSADVRSGCGIFTQQMMEDSNVEDVGVLQGKIDNLVDALECGDWEFPRYAAKQ